jgi:glutaconate CoA-transferase subunit A
MPLFTPYRLAETIPNGAHLAIPADYGGVAISVTLELIRRRVQDLSLVAAPVAGLQADLLIGAGTVRQLEAAAVSLGEYGFAHRFTAALKEGRLRMLDATCPALHAGFQAAEKGVPFLPLRGILGSDLLKLRPDWKVIQNPMTETDDPIVVVPAIRPDIALFHAPLADRHGNVWVSVRRELITLAHAAQRSLVSVEAIFEGNLLEDPLYAPGTLPHPYVEAVAHAPKGTWPLAFAGHYEADHAALSRYAETSRTQEGFEAILKEWLHG